MLRNHFHDRRNRSNRPLKQVFVLLACLSASTYFAYHAVYGRHGLQAYQRLTERASILTFENKSLEGVRTKLERDVALLSPELPNPDMVEEIARDMLGYTHPQDKIIAAP